MVPSAVVVLDGLPLTVNGKVDRRALPAPSGERPELAGEFVAPRTAAEQAISAVWSELLGIARVGVHDNFFELGGDSILGIRVVSRLRAAGYRLTPRMIFQYQNVAELAARAEVAVVAAGQGPLSLIDLNNSRSDQKAFCFFASGGAISNYQELGNLLESDIKFLGIAPTDDYVEWIQKASLRELAEKCAAVVKARQSSGPYLLIGWSFGAVIEFETARLLQDAGEKADVLVVIDGPLPHQLSKEHYDSVRARFEIANDWLRQGGELGDPDNEAPVEVKILLNQVNITAEEAAENPDVISELIRMDSAHWRLLAEYEPGYLDRPVLFFEAESRTFPFEIAETWRGRVGDITRRVIPGNHFSILDRPSVDSIAADLKLWLRRHRCKLAGSRSCWRRGAVRWVSCSPGTRLVRRVRWLWWMGRGVVCRMGRWRWCRGGWRGCWRMRGCRWCWRTPVWPGMRPWPGCGRWWWRVWRTVRGWRGSRRLVRGWWCIRISWRT